MSRFRLSEFDKEMNAVLHHQSKELDKIKAGTANSADKYIEETEKMLLELGYSLPESICVENSFRSKKVMVVPTWEELRDKSVAEFGKDCDLESLFTKEELKRNKSVLIQLNEEYNSLHRLDKYDIAIAALAGIVGAVVDILLIGIPKKTEDGPKAGPLSNYVRNYFDKRFPEKEMQKLANSKISKVPFDAQDNRNTSVNIEGLSAYYHRLLQLGHDPLLGFVFGVADILSGTMTTIDKSGKIVSQVMENYADRKESDIFAALMKQVAHLKSDITTSMGLPVPLMGLFNLLQFGSIGEEDQTIAEIVQGMYFDGYDFVHFCSMSVSSMLVEVVVRFGYAVKRRKEGYSLQESVPSSTNREKHPKLAAMLFMGHAGAAALNSGKVYFMKNPVAINYPEWIAFAKYSYMQLKWILIEKSKKRDKYVLNKINDDLNILFDEVNKSFDDFSGKYVVMFS